MELLAHVFSSRLHGTASTCFSPSFHRAAGYCFSHHFQKGSDVLYSPRKFGGCWKNGKYTDVRRARHYTRSLAKSMGVQVANQSSSSGRFSRWSPAGYNDGHSIDRYCLEEGPELSALPVDDEGWLNQTSGPVQEATDAELEDRIRKQVADDVSESKRRSWLRW